MQTFVTKCFFFHNFDQKIQRNLSNRIERFFLMRLVEGTVERCIELDYVIDQFSKVKVKKMKPVIRR